MEKLSKLMLRGALHTEKSVNAYFLYDSHLNVCYTCAVGAVLFEMGVKTYEGALNLNMTCADAIESNTGVDMYLTRRVHPVTGETSSLWRIITTLNDSFDWRRERIAAWLRSIGL